VSNMCCLYHAELFHRDSLAFNYVVHFLNTGVDSIK
jgi:hypothetical protein